MHRHLRYSTTTLAQHCFSSFFPPPQIITNDKGFMGESFLKHPASLAKLLALLGKARAAPFVLLSGDVHMAEISRCSCPFLPPIYELTSSGMTHSWKGPREPLVQLISGGFRRIGTLYTGKNVGEVALQQDTSSNVTTVHLRVLNREGSIVKEQVIATRELAFPPLPAAMQADVMACAASDPHKGLTPACARLLQSCQQPSDEDLARAQRRFLVLVASVVVLLSTLFLLPCALLCGCLRSRVARRASAVAWVAAVAFVVQLARQK